MITRLAIAGYRSLRDTCLVSHARALVTALGAAETCRAITLETQLGETRVTDVDHGSTPSWTCPTR